MRPEDGAGGIVIVVGLVERTPEADAERGIRSSLHRRPSEAGVGWVGWVLETALIIVTEPLALGGAVGPLREPRGGASGSRLSCSLSQAKSAPTSSIITEEIRTPQPNSSGSFSSASPIRYGSASPRPNSPRAPSYSQPTPRYPTLSPPSSASSPTATHQSLYPHSSRPDLPHLRQFRTPSLHLRQPATTTTTKNQLCATPILGIRTYLDTEHAQWSTRTRLCALGAEGML